jgi:hypothetical protein
MRIWFWRSLHLVVVRLERWAMRKRAYAAFHYGRPGALTATRKGASNNCMIIEGPKWRNPCLK